MILNHIIEIYILMWMSVILHEFAHVLIARIINLKIESVHIGDEFFSCHICKFYISPVIFLGSYLEFSTNEMKTKTKRQRTMFFIAGPVMNLCIALLSYVFRMKHMLYMDSLFWINIYYFVVNCFPLSKKNDGSKLYRYWKD